MARRKKKEVEEDEDLDEEEDEEEDEDDVDDAAIARDYVMARLAAALVSARAAVDGIEEALILFVQPEEDKEGAARDELIDSAVEALGASSTALEAAAKAWDDDEVDPELGEPDEEG